MKGKPEGYAHLTAKIDQLKSELAKAVAAERERCAKVCERNIVAPAGTYQILMAAADAIRKGEAVAKSERVVPEFELIEKWEGE